MVRWMSDPLKEKMTGFRREVAPVPDEEDRLAKLDAKLLQDPPPEYRATNVTQGQQTLPQLGSERPLSLGLQQTESMPLLRAETPTKKSQSIWQLPDRLKGYKTSLRSVTRRERRVTSAPVGHFSYNPESTDTGIGTQYGSANKSTTALQSDSNDLEMSSKFVRACFVVLADPLRFTTRHSRQRPRRQRRTSRGPICEHILTHHR